MEKKIDQLAWGNYWEKNPGKALAENSRPDMVIGYVDGWNAAEKQRIENIETDINTAAKKYLPIIRDDMLPDSTEEQYIETVMPYFKVGWYANPAQYTEKDMLSFHGYCRDNPQLTHQELLQQYKLTQNQQ